MQFDHDKFKALLHYVVWKAGDKDGFGATKLYKILWFSDARAYMLHSEPITGERYVREKYGPMPAHALSVIHELTNDGAIRVSKDTYYNKPIRHFHSLRTPDRLALDRAIDDAKQRWLRAHDAWETVSWVIARAPEDGAPVTESGATRSFTLDGARSIGLPTITVLYEIRLFEVIVHDARFEDAKFAQAGRA